MRPNLSFENLVGTLAALGTTAILAGCGGAQPPVKGTEVAPSTAPTAAGQQSCSAAGCGANKGAASAAPAVTPPAMPAPTDVAPATTANAAPSAVPPATTASAKPPAPPAVPKKAPPPPPKGTGTGQQSCGPGTCGTDPKKK